MRGRFSYALTATLAAVLIALLVGPAAAVTFNVLESDQAHTVIEIEIPPAELSSVQLDGQPYDLLTIDGTHAYGDVGDPTLAVAATLIAVPPSSGVELRVLDSQYKTMPCGQLLPVQAEDREPGTEIAYNAEAYARGSSFPGNAVIIGDPAIMRDYRVVPLRFYPASYDAQAGELRVATRMTVELVYSATGATNIKTTERPESPAFRSLYEAQIANYGFVKPRYESDSRGKYLIITADTYYDNILPLADWKHKMGFEVEIAKLSVIGSSYTQIKSYIQNYYDTHDLAYVLLVGDAAQVPTLTGGGGSSDPSYSLLAGSDNYPDIFVGRFSAENTADVATQVTRSVEYEKQPQSGADWYHEGMGVASDQGPGDDGEYDYQHIDNIRTDLLGFTYTDVDQIYDPSGTAAMVTSGLNSGRGIITYCGHGSTTSWGSTGFSNTHVNALTNDNLLPFIISVACVNGNFVNYTCFAEAWLRATNGSEPTGAVGTYMSSVNQSWNPPMQAED